MKPTRLHGIVMILGMLVLIVCAASLAVAENGRSLDICCGHTGDCPDGYGCSSGGPECSAEWQGYCVPIPPESAYDRDVQGGQTP